MSAALDIAAAVDRVLSTATDGLLRPTDPGPAITAPAHLSCVCRCEMCADGPAGGALPPARCRPMSAPLAYCAGCGRLAPVAEQANGQPFCRRCVEQIDGRP